MKGRLVIMFSRVMKIKVLSMILIITLCNTLIINHAFAAKNFDSLDKYYKIEIKLGDYEIALDKKWIAAMKIDAESAKEKSETGKDVKYIVDNNMYNSYKKEMDVLHQKGKTIKLLAENGVDCTESLIGYENDVEYFKTKWNNYIDGIKEQEPINNKKKKIIGHANVGAKIWSPGDSISDILLPDSANPMNTQISNESFVTDSEVYFDLGNMGTISGPRILDVNNGIIEIIDAKSRMNVDEDGQYPYIELKYKATIFDSKKDSLKFYLNSIEINVSVYDEITTYLFSDKGNYVIHA